MPKEKHEKTPKRRYIVSYRAEDGFFYADPKAHRDQAARIVLGPMTRALEAIWSSAVEIKVSEAAA